MITVCTRKKLSPIKQRDHQLFTIHSITRCGGRAWDYCYHYELEDDDAHAVITAGTAREYVNLSECRASEG